MTNATSAAALTAREREKRAVSLRLSGVSYRQIGEALGVSAMGAHKAVSRVLARTAEKTSEDAAQLRALEVERLDELQLIAAAVLRHAMPELRLKAIDRVLRIGERRAKLLGLDSPTLARVDLTVLDDAQLEALARGEDPHAVLARRPEPFAQVPAPTEEPPVVVVEPEPAVVVDDDEAVF